MGINGEMQEMRAEQAAKEKEAMEQARIERHAERIAREQAKAFIVEAMVHECRDRGPSEPEEYDKGFHDGYTSCLMDLARENGLSWAKLADDALRELGLYRCP